MDRKVCYVTYEGIWYKAILVGRKVLKKEGIFKGRVRCLVEIEKESSYVTNSMIKILKEYREEDIYYDIDLGEE